MVRAPAADFAPSPAATKTGEAFKPEFLAESNLCGVADCHPNLYSEWVRSRHHLTLSERYRSQLEALVEAQGFEAARLCAGCHDPISLLSGSIDNGRPLHAPEALREGISCIVCHGLSAPERGGTELGNGSVVYRPPEFYYQGPIQLQTLIGSWREHRSDLHSDALRDDRLCVSCHRFVEQDDPALAAWLSHADHAQAQMLDECRGETGCRDCHMPRTTASEKPGPNLPYHGFGTPPDDD